MPSALHVPQKTQLTMLLSVIIPHYNLTKELLTRCIASITTLELPLEDYEIIIVDDGSAEPPAWIESIYKHNNLRLITAGHEGPGAARNRGMNEAKGEYIMFLDADDYLMQNNDLRQCLEFLKREKPEILRFRQIASTSGRYPKRKKTVKFSTAIPGAGFMAKNNLPGSPCTYLFMREPAMNKGIKFPTNIFHEDEEFNTILHYHASSLVCCNADIYYYCIREGSTTTNSSDSFKAQRLENIFQVIERLSSFKETFSASASVQQKKAIDRKLATLAVDAVINMIYMGKSDAEILELCSSRLGEYHLYPLPKAAVSLKYFLFRKLANSERGIGIIRSITLRNSSPKK